MWLLEFNILNILGVLEIAFLILNFRVKFLLTTISKYIYHKN